MLYNNQNRGRQALPKFHQIDQNTNRPYQNINLVGIMLIGILTLGIKTVTQPRSDKNWSSGLQQLIYSIQKLPEMEPVKVRCATPT